jgi:hypothetical protein
MEECRRSWTEPTTEGRVLQISCGIAAIPRTSATVAVGILDVNRGWSARSYRKDAIENSGLWTYIASKNIKSRLNLYYFYYPICYNVFHKFCKAWSKLHLKRWVLFHNNIARNEYCRKKFSFVLLMPNIMDIICYDHYWRSSVEMEMRTTSPLCFLFIYLMHYPKCATLD